MDNQVLIRVYNVGLGDCIYVRVPDKTEYRHILIDCGTFSRAERLEKAVADLEKTYLPKDSTGKLQLDLLIVTHNHKDHLSGFGVSSVSKWFQKIDIKQIWLSAGMNPNHPQAGKTFQLLEFADKAIKGLSAISLGTAYDELAEDLLSARGDPDAEDNIKALEMLRETLPKKLKGKKQPTYVDDGMKDGKVPGIFAESTTRLRVLAPVFDIDGTYLGKLGDALVAFESFQDHVGFIRGKRPEQARDLPKNFMDSANQPANISEGDFLRLRERLIYQALAFVTKGHGELANNTSVILLLEWRGRRLMFVGDAQCKIGREEIYISGAINGSWNAMWERHNDLLKQPLDFIKIGHHGSHNATPWSADNPGDPVNKILDALIPPTKTDCRAVVSTERTQNDNFKRTIPQKELMIEIGRRLQKPATDYDETARYPDLIVEFGSCFVPKGKPQPLRTDLESGDSVTITIP